MSEAEKLETEKSYTVQENAAIAEALSKKPVTMKDIARKSGLSATTVSRALKNSEQVSLYTRLRVEQAACDTGYLPPSLNRYLRQNAIQPVLVVVPDIRDPIITDIIRGIENTAIEYGYLVIIANSTHQKMRHKNFIDLIIGRKIHGVLLLSGHLPRGIKREDRRHLPPLVLVNDFAPELELPSVHIDNLTASFQAVNYLYELGHQRVACIAGPEQLSVSHYRLQGYIQALARNGHILNPQYIVRGELNYKTGSQGLARLLSLPRPPTAIFCHCDATAFGAMFYAKKLRLNVPEDLSIMGFDNIALAEISDPPLTTIAQPRFEMGRQAMLLLIDKMAGKTVKNGSRMLDCELIERGSTCCQVKGRRRRRLAAIR